MSDHGFTVWMAKVDSIMERVVGVSSSDLPDWAYRDAYEGEVEPKEAAREALAAAGWNDEDEGEEE